jgi:anti-sigma factor RsiW
VDGDTWNDDAALLEAHLDGALSPPQAESLGRRLANEPALAAHLERLRAERAVRQAVWSSYEPDQSRAASAATSALTLAERAERLRRTASHARRATAAAAVVLLAFASGWVARGVRSVQPGAPESRDVQSGGNHPFASSGASAGDGSASFPVALTDEHGNIIAVQHFDNPRKAREFADDVDRWQSRPRRAAPPAAPLTPVSDEF